MRYKITKIEECVKNPTFLTVHAEGSLGPVTVHVLAERAREFFVDGALWIRAESGD